MESAMPSVSPMASSMPSPPDIKPDISTLGHPMSSIGNMSNMHGYFSMGHVSQSQMSPLPPLQSPTMTSPTGPMQSPGSSMGSLTPSFPSLGSPVSSISSPSSHMGQMSSKHICAICGDRASGKHYGVYRYDVKMGKWLNFQYSKVERRNIIAYNKLYFRRLKFLMIDKKS